MYPPTHPPELKNVTKIFYTKCFFYTIKYLKCLFNSINFKSNFINGEIQWRKAKETEREEDKKKQDEEKEDGDERDGKMGTMWRMGMK